MLSDSTVVDDAKNKRNFEGDEDFGGSESIVSEGFGREDGLISRIEELTKENDNLRITLDEANNMKKVDDLRIDELQKNLEDSRKNNYYNDLQEYKSFLEKKKEEDLQIQATITNLKKEIEDKNSNVVTLKSRLHKAGEMDQSSEDVIKDLRLSNEKLKVENDNLQREIEEIRKKMKERDNASNKESYNSNNEGYRTEINDDDILLKGSDLKSIIAHYISKQITSFDSFLETTEESITKLNQRIDLVKNISSKNPDIIEKQPKTEPNIENIENNNNNNFNSKKKAFKPIFELPKPPTPPSHLAGKEGNFEFGAVIATPVGSSGFSGRFPFPEQIRRQEEQKKKKKRRKSPYRNAKTKNFLKKNKNDLRKTVSSDTLIVEDENDNNNNNIDLSIRKTVSSETFEEKDVCGNNNNNNNKIENIKKKRKKSIKKEQPPPEQIKIKKKEEKKEEVEEEPKKRMKKKESISKSPKKKKKKEIVVIEEEEEEEEDVNNTEEDNEKLKKKLMKQFSNNNNNTSPKKNKNKNKNKNTKKLRINQKKNKSVSAPTSLEINDKKNKVITEEVIEIKEKERTKSSSSIPNSSNININSNKGKITDTDIKEILSYNKPNSILLDLIKQCLLWFDPNIKLPQLKIWKDTKKELRSHQKQKTFKKFNPILYNNNNLKNNNKGSIKKKKKIQNYKIMKSTRKIISGKKNERYKIYKKSKIAAKLYDFVKIQIQVIDQLNKNNNSNNRNSISGNSRASSGRKKIDFSSKRKSTFF